MTLNAQALAGITNELLGLLNQPTPEALVQSMQTILLIKDRAMRLILLRLAANRLAIQTLKLTTQEALDEADAQAAQGNGDRLAGAQPQAEEGSTLPQERPTEAG